MNSFTYFLMIAVAEWLHTFYWKHIKHGVKIKAKPYKKMLLHVFIEKNLWNTNKIKNKNV